MIVHLNLNHHSRKGKHISWFSWDMYFRNNATLLHVENKKQEMSTLQCHNKGKEEKKKNRLELKRADQIIRIPRKSQNSHHHNCKVCLYDVFRHCRAWIRRRYRVEVRLFGADTGWEKRSSRTKHLFGLAFPWTNSVHRASLLRNITFTPIARCGSWVKRRKGHAGEGNQLKYRTELVGGAQLPPKTTL